MGAKSISSVLEALEKQIGDKIVSRWDKKPDPVEAISTGVLSVDDALSIGGIPRRCITVWFGPESAGKTTLSLWMLGHLINDGGTGVYIDIEQGGSEEWVYNNLRAVGINVEEAMASGSLVVLRPKLAEDAVKAAKALIPYVDLIIFDSISAMLTKLELEAPTGDNLMGIRARFQTREFSKMNILIEQSRCALLLISHIRARIGGYGSNETTTEPHAIRQLASLRVRFSMGGTAKLVKGKAVIQPAKIVVRKNKVGIPKGRAEFDILIGKGIEVIPDTLVMAKKTGVIRAAGGNHYYPPDEGLDEYIMRTSSGAEALVFLRENPGIAAKIREEVLVALGK